MELVEKLAYACTADERAASGRCKGRSIPRSGKCSTNLNSDPVDMTDCLKLEFPQDFTD